MKDKYNRFLEILDRFGGGISEKGLIKFDRRVFFVFFASLSLFFLAVSLKINGSSVGVWDSYINSEPGSASTIVGLPKAIRSDEWLVLTPFMLSQSKKGFPVENPNIGGKKDSLLVNLPAKHFSMIARPQFWGYFLFNPERGFSFFWNFKIFGLFLSSFLLFLFLTKNNFYLSLLGSLWIFFSSFIQWWFSIPLPEMITGFNIVVLSFSYILFSKKKSLVIASSMFFMLFFINFILFLYPPFQIALVYLGAAIVLGLLLTEEYRAILKEHLFGRLGLVLILSAISGIFLLLFYAETKETVRTVMATVYPGKRISLGGEVSIAKLFSGFTGYPKVQGKLPAMFENSSEASNFLLFFPLIFVMIFRNFVLKAKINKVILMISFYLGVFSTWTLVKYPVILGRISLLSYIPSKRALLGIGLASVFLVILYMSEKEERPDKKFSLFLSLLVFGFFTVFAFFIKSADAVSFGYKYLLLTSLLFTVTSYFIIRKQVFGVFVMVVILTVIPNALVNPVSAGLEPLTKKDVSSLARELDNDDKKWVVYGDHVYANFFKAAGLNVFNGTKFTPDMDLLSTLDETGQYEDIYNRYAHISVWEPEKPGAPKIFLVHADAYVIELDPCSGFLKKLGISNVIFTYKPSSRTESCLALENFSEKENIYFFTLKD